jgi:hypothetical protein
MSPGGRRVTAADSSSRDGRFSVAESAAPQGSTQVLQQEMGLTGANVAAGAAGAAGAVSAVGAVGAVVYHNTCTTQRSPHHGVTTIESQLSGALGDTLQIEEVEGRMYVHFQSKFLL